MTAATTPALDTSSAEDRHTRDLRLARAEIAALEQLLEVHEQTSLSQANKLEQLLRERNLALADVQRSREDLLRVFEQAPAAISSTSGPNHIVQSVNAEYRKLIGNRDIVGKPIRDAFPELGSQSVFFDLMDQVFRTGQAFVGNEQPASIDRRGTGVWEEGYFNFVYQPLLDSAGAVWGIMIHAIEVTGQVLARRELERTTNDLQTLTSALERSNKELDQFAYVASHDLKAPLRGIANLAQWIQEDVGDKLSGESAEHMGLLHGRVQRMEALIDGILTYSRAARVARAFEPIDTACLAVEVVDLLAPPSTTRVAIAAGMPIMVAERVPLQQVFMNLIGNALKYGNGPEAAVDIGSEDNESAYEFFVRDNGPGIAPEYHERIWGIFQTLEARDKVEGTGIGLAVVRKIVESRGGLAWIESEPGRGATFRFTWPKHIGES